MSSTILDRIRLSPDERRAEILKAVELFEDARKTYADSPGEHPPGAGLFHLATNIVLAFAAGAVPRELLGAMKVVEDLGELLLRLATDPGVNLSTYSPAGNFWGLAEAIRAAIHAEIKEPDIESFEVLAKQHLTSEQIAKIHGLDLGTVRTWMDDPKKIPADYVPPALAKLREERRELALRPTSNGLKLSVVAPQLLDLGFGAHQASVEPAEVA